MAAPARKHPLHIMRPPPVKDHLRLVKGQAGKKPDHSLGTLVSFLAGVGAALFALIYFSPTPELLALPTELQSFSTLHETYRKFGIEQYLKEKQNLRQNVEVVLRTNSEAQKEARRSARNIAVYLFPEVLGMDDFEQGSARELWLPQQEAIERLPRSRESRLWFEDLRAAIWNYENPVRTSPRISPYAEQVIRIFDLMSQPGTK